MLSLALALSLAFAPADTLGVRTPAPAALLAAVHEYVTPLSTSAEDIRMRTEWADVSGDGVDDALVYVDAVSWCGSGGCTVLVFETITDAEEAAELGAYRAAAEISLMSGPVTVSETRTEGWADLIVRNADGDAVTLRFDGETYPASPAEGVAAASTAGVTLFAAAE